MKFSICLLSLVSILFIPVPSAGADRDLLTKQVLEQATVKYRTDFVVEAPLEIWDKVLAHPLLMARLWNVYNFQPAYEVKDQKEGILVIDPSGIKGKLAMTESRPDGRSFYGWGSVDHWAIPSFISAEGIFRFRYTGDGRRVRGTFEAFMKGDNKTTDFLMKLVRGKVKNLLHRRFTNNLNDMKKIIADIVQNPDHIRGRLTGGDLKEFNNAF